jgi:hypothetical protein
MSTTKHNHKEAFYLMWYGCRQSPGAPKDVGCGHRERIWNSRDGVTPFTTSCPSCGGELMHINWGQDAYAPEHKLHQGQRFWRNITREEAMITAHRRIEYVKKYYPSEQPRTEAEEQTLFENLADSIYREGTAPWLDERRWGS